MVTPGGGGEYTNQEDILQSFADKMYDDERGVTLEQSPRKRRVLYSQFGRKRRYRCRYQQWLWIRSPMDPLQLVDLDPDPYWQSGPGSSSWESDQNLQINLVSCLTKRLLYLCIVGMFLRVPIT